VGEDTANRAFKVVGVDRDSFTGAETTTPLGPKGAVATSVHQWGLFIAYDGDGFVCAHEVRRIETLDFKSACIAWRRALQKNGKHVEPMGAGDAGERSR
jgi:hypothetical protein